MKVTFWGTRGSIAKAGPSTVRYGGNTSCVEIRSEAGTLIVVDCGTGAHGLGVDLLARGNGAPMEGHLLITHTHWDHIQGLPFFAPLFQPQNNWHIYGPRGLADSVIDTLAGQMQYSYFPVTIEQLAAQVEYHDLVEGTFEIDDVAITAQYLNHPALTLGYRLEADGATVVYSSDHEPHSPELAAGGDFSVSRYDTAHLRFLEGADLLIHDAQYLAGEYEAKKGWGHSTVEYVADAARQAGVARLALYHHDPSRNDDAVDDVVELARAHVAPYGFSGEVFAAEEGMEIDVVGARPKTNGQGASTGPATRTPALEQVNRSVLIAVRSSEVAGIVRDAAEAEQLEVLEADDPTAAVEMACSEHPGIIVLEDEGDALEQVRTFRDVESDGADVNIVTVTRSGATEIVDPHSMTDWMIWPFSAVYARTKLHASLLRRACRWQTAPLPPDEDRRLAALRNLGVLDTDPEERFDRLTKHASAVLGMPIALVSLVDAKRQWFKSAHGLDVGETDRDVAFCAHAILDDQVFQVPDALMDPRFAENPIVSGEPRIRFYAGAPLALSDGSAAGTLCVVDYRPRLLNDEQLEDLRHIATLVVHELEAGVRAEVQTD